MRSASAIVIALLAVGCVASPEDNPYARCGQGESCAPGERCYRGLCIRDDRDGGPADLDAAPIDASDPPDAPTADAPEAPDAGLDAGPPDAGCPGAGAPCGTSMAGVCAAGTTECTATGLACVRDVDPSSERCDSEDDDCDGAIDEDADAPCFTGASGCVPDGSGGFACEGVCAPGVQRCVSGSLGVCDGEIQPSGGDGCTPPGLAAVDDDCDGAVDDECTCTEGETRPCYAGPAGTAGVGACTEGTTTCTGGRFGACTGSVMPVAEACDNAGADDDCNGTVDDVAGTGVPCTVSGALGVCADGVTACSGTDVACVGPSARAERCDGTDDDCDGIVDDGFDLDTSEDHCGGCGLSCGPGRTCCGGTCVSTDSDAAHCGDCGTACSGSASACCRSACRAPTAGECTGCPTDCSASGQTCCSGTCVDTTSDSANCGGCGAGFACDAGERCCGGTCVADSDAHCGSCTPCAAGDQCCGPAGSGACVADLDPMNCGGCGVRCGSGQTCCELGCSNLLADVRNCGACGVACGATEVCSSGLCCPAGTTNSNGVCCAPGWTGCGGVCRHLSDDEANCGSCGNACSGLAPRCCSGSCALAISCS